ncbi:hypothetical protein [Labilibaculum sp.]|nr:hypothetical protein [Labilibaculum sp.]
MNELMKQIEGTELISSEELAAKYGGTDVPVEVDNGCSSCKTCVTKKK